ncbi:hypothetical protein NKG05_07815 [Oerskovia sp. M15]
MTEERYLTPGAEDPNVVIVRQGDGLGRGIQASTGLAALVGASDGELTVGQLITAIASLFEVPAGQLAGSCCRRCGAGAGRLPGAVTSWGAEHAVGVMNWSFSNANHMLDRRQPHVRQRRTGNPAATAARLPRLRP